MPTGLPVMKPGSLAPRMLLELVHHPQHVLAVGHDVGGGDVLQGAHVAGHLADPARGRCPSCSRSDEVVRVADDAALAAAEGDVHHGALPGHPRGQGADRVDGLVGVEADAALARAAGVVVLDAEALEDLGACRRPSGPG